MKNIILCADDYGQNPSISQAIINLIEKNRLTATSCMTNGPKWSNYAKWLNPYKNQVDTGLHLNLTEGRSLSGRFQMMPLITLLSRACFYQLDRSSLAAEINAQLDSYINAFDQLPDFIDGHQHVHQFPLIRDVLLEVYEKRLKTHQSYIRSVSMKNVFMRFREDAYFKKIIIQLMGANEFKSELIKRQIPHNSSFSGIYHFKNGKDYAKKFPQFLRDVQEGGIIMCHPGLFSDGEADPIYVAREYEYRYFLSDQFLKLFQNAYF